MIASDVMTRNVISIDPESTVLQAARLMLPSLGDIMTEGECGGTGLSTCKRMNRVKPGVWVEV